jgi:hypothetical protein
VRRLGTDGATETESRRDGGSLPEGGSGGAADKWIAGEGVRFIGAHVRAMRSWAERVSARHDRAVACTRALGSGAALARQQR